MQLARPQSVMRSEEEDCTIDTKRSDLLSVNWKIDAEHLRQFDDVR